MVVQKSFCIFASVKQQNIKGYVQQNKIKKRICRQNCVLLFRYRFRTQDFIDGLKDNKREIYDLCDFEGRITDYVEYIAYKYNYNNTYLFERQFETM